MMLKKLLTLSLAVSACLAAASKSDASIIVLDDFDSNRILPLNSNQGGGTIAVTDSPDADADNELQKVTGTTANFTSFVKTPVLARTGAVMNALLNGDQISLRVLGFNADLSQNLNVRIVANTNAWVTDPGNTYHGLSQISLNDGADRDLTLTFNYTTSSAFYQALQAYSTGAGSFFELTIDNSGFPGISTAQTFYLDDFGVRQIPEPASLALVGMGAALMLRRRGV